MPRSRATIYRRQMAVLMAIYVLATLLLLPQARAAANVPWKTLLALLPTLPIVIVIWLTATFVMASDELEQRLHLVGLSVATGIVGALSVMGGFLCATGVVNMDGDVLIWVFPALTLIYGGTHWLAARRYGVVGC
jgi:hypothetical protein